MKFYYNSYTLKGKEFTDNELCRFEDFLEKYKPDVYKKIKDAEDCFNDISFLENSGSGSMSSYEKLAKNVDPDFFNSTKIKQLMALLDETREKNPYEKTIGILLC